MPVFSATFNLLNSSGSGSSPITMAIVVENVVNSGGGTVSGYLAPSSITIPPGPGNLAVPTSFTGQVTVPPGVTSYTATLIYTPGDMPGGAEYYSSGSVQPSNGPNCPTS